MSTVVHVTTEEQEKKYFEVFYKLYPNASRPGSKNYVISDGFDAGFNMNDGKRFSHTTWTYYKRMKDNYGYELIEFDEFLKRFDPSYRQPKFKVGDTVKILSMDPIGHCYPIGSKQEIKSVNAFRSTYQQFTYEVGGSYQTIRESQLELVVEQSTPQFVSVKGGRELETLFNEHQFNFTTGGRLIGCDCDWFYNLDLSKKISINETKTPEYQEVTVKELEQMLNQTNKTMKTKEEIYKEMQAQWVKITGLKVGDSVKCTRNWESGEQGFKICGVNDRYVGLVQKVIKINNDCIECPEGNAFPYFALEIVDVPKEEIVTLYDETREVTVHPDGRVECGCLKLSKENALTVLAHVESIRTILKGYDVTLSIEGSEIQPEDMSSIRKLIK